MSDSTRSIEQTGTSSWEMQPSTSDRRQFFSFYCYTLTDPEDYREFMSVLEIDFGAVKTGQINGPYSTHVDVNVRGIPMVVVLDSPEEIVLSMANQGIDRASLLANEILAALRRRLPQ